MVGDVTLTVAYANAATVLGTNNFNAVTTKTRFEGIAIPLTTMQVMDGLGRICNVIKKDYQGDGSVSGSTITENLTFRYKYGNRNRLAEKIIPDAEPQVFYYDNRNLVTLSQDGNMRAETTDHNKYLGSQFDQFERLWKMGFITSASRYNAH